MFCDSYNTSLVWYGLACSGKPSLDENGSNSWNSPVHKVNAAHSTGTLERALYDVLRVHQPHTHLIWTRLFREALSHRKRVKIMELASTQSKRGTFNSDPERDFYDVLRFQWHHARLIWDPRAASCTNRASLMLINNKKQCVWLFFISCCSVFFSQTAKV